MNISIVIIILIVIVAAVIIGYGIVKTIDEKLSSVVVNVPKHNYDLPPIYLNIDKDSGIKRVKLNDVIGGENILADESVFFDTSESPPNIIETTDPIDDNSTNSTSSTNTTILTGDFDKNMAIINAKSNKYNNYDYGTIDQSPTDGSYENFGNLKEFPVPTYSDNDKAEFSKKQDPNFNLLTDIPLLVSPDIISPNMKTTESYPYYSNKAKLVDKKKSQLVQLQDLYLNKISAANKASINSNQLDNFDNVSDDSTNFPINGPFDGYNSHVKLQDYSYGNVTSIGKSLLTPFVNYPLPVNQ